MGTNLLAEDLQIVYEELEQRVAARTRQLHEAHREMQRMAMTDPLTGLHNRSAFAAALAESLNRDPNGNQRPGILLMDMNGFKGVNDSLGHSIGDKVLETVAARISAAVREEDMVARMGATNSRSCCRTLPRPRRLPSAIASSLPWTIRWRSTASTYDAAPAWAFGWQIPARTPRN